jgi:hypothetical protein
MEPKLWGRHYGAQWIAFCLKSCEEWSKIFPFFQGVIICVHKVGARRIIQIQNSKVTLDSPSGLSWRKIVDYLYIITLTLRPPSQLLYREARWYTSHNPWNTVSPKPSERRSPPLSYVIGFQILVPKGCISSKSQYTTLWQLLHT